MPASGPALARRLALILILTLALTSACEPEPTPAQWTIGLTTNEDVGAFLSAWGPNSSEVYIAGGNPEAGALWRFDGETWQADDIPGCLPLANWVYGFDTDAGSIVWLAANDGKAARRDGEGNWTCMDLATPNALWGIWGAADDDMWAVGGNLPNNDPGEAPILAHWDGSAWTLVELPEIDRSFGACSRSGAPAPTRSGPSATPASCCTGTAARGRRSSPARAQT
ncbi:MAG: hypothetical protein HC927_11810 [Deltaproteobacteria bacterium]|nr:hypothetical protein [Deltaproteobacteria bacterium]